MMNEKVNSKKLKIAMIGHKRVPGRDGGGVEVVVEELATRLATHGNAVTLYNRHRKNVDNKVKNYKGVKLIDTFTINSKKLDAVIYSFLASIHAVFCKYDIIHYHALGPSVMLIIPHVFGKKTVVTVHGLNYKTPKWKGFGAKYIKLGEIITVKYADEVIVLSKEIQAYFMKKYGRKVNYVPNGVTMPKIRNVNLIKERYALEKDEYILFLSRIVPGKGLENLIHVFKQVNTNKKLVIAGSSSSSYMDDFYNDMVKLADGDKRIIFTGFVSGELLDELYSNAHLFVFPSEAEGMPMCLLEAMSYNCPCLVSEIVENVEILKEYGSSFRVSDAADLKEKLEALLDNGIEVKDTRSYVKDNFDWENVVEKTLQIYEG